MARVEAPRVTPKEITVLSIEQIRSLLAGCSSRRFEDLRDQAIIRLFADTHFVGPN
ncbi:MAG TPA: hypothetical protein VM282_24510 [Acidimicrobiales bacterium]|nr:hypothetical protein [Acidimicrobiales bacterium]